MNTAFYDMHLEAGAKMVDFVGFKMPIEYAGVKEEHLCVRNNAGVFDVSHMGEVWVKGPNALDFLQRVCSNDVSKLTDGCALYSCFPNGKGGIVDDLIVYYFDAETYLLVINASNIDKDFAWLQENIIDGVTLSNVSAEMSQLAIQGPKATEILQRLTDVDLSAIAFYNFTTGTFAGVENVILSATGYTGSGGFEIYFENRYAKQVWEALFEAGKPEGIQPIGLAARDTLRLEKGYCLYGNDIDDTTSPIEAGLGWITKFIDGKDFIDRDVMAALKEKGVSKRLRGFKMIERGIPRKDYEICDSDGNTIGRVTSGTQSPVLNQGIGMGYVATSHTKFGSEIYIRIRKKIVKAEVVRMPFV